MLKSLFGQLLQPDITFALLLILIAAAVFFAVRIGVLPKKSAPFVAVALLAAAGFSVYRQKHARNLQAILKEKEQELKKRDEVLKEMKKQYQLSDQEAETAVARRNAEIQAITEEIIQNRASSELEAVKAMTAQQRRDYVLNLNL